MNSDATSGFCRFCGGALFAAPLLALRNIPSSAQGFLDEADLSSDVGETLDILECAQCGLVQIAGAPVPYYREVIRASAVSPEMQAYREAQFSAFSKRYNLENADVIEVGCGKGEYLQILSPFVGHAWGIEASPDAVKACRDAGLKVIEGFLGEATYPDALPRYSGFFLLNFLEHIPSPNTFLSHLSSLLNEDAVGLVEVPNADMIFRNGLFSEFIRDHIFYFTQDTLRRVLEQNGFAVESCAVTWHEYTITAEVRRRQPRMEARRSLSERMQSLCVGLQAAVAERVASGKRVAVWGAGHQALALLAIAELGEQIAYVVDSAPFKQGRYTPATHCKIVPPTTLASDPVDTILVICGSYSSEVVSILAREFPDIEAGVMTESGIHWQSQDEES